MNAPQSDELTAFLLSKKNSAPAPEIDWQKRRQEWLDALAGLYKKITEELLSESITRQLVTVSQSEKEITEEHLGKYRAQELILDISGEVVRLSPKGRNIIGAKGRVDLVGDLDSMTLVLEPDGQWSIVLSRVPRQVVNLDRKTFAEALQRVMR
jgi:hypothetical protein